MVVKKCVTEFIMEYVFSFRLWESVFSNVSGIYYQWALKEPVMKSASTESVFDKVHATTSSEEFYDGDVFLASLFDGVWF